MASRTSNPHLALWIAATGLSHGEIARRVAAEAVRQGHRQITPDATRVSRWIDGERPRPPVPTLLAAVLSETVGQPLTPGDLGLTAAGAVLDTIQVPLLTEAAAQTLATEPAVPRHRARRPRRSLHAVRETAPPALGSVPPRPTAARRCQSPPARRGRCLGARGAPARPMGT